MQIHQLRYVLAVAENKSFSAAAKKLFLAQPSLSQQIINLEKELGIALFVRHPKSVTLTDAGEQFLKSARRIVNEVDQLSDLMQKHSQLQNGTLRIGLLWVASYLNLSHILTDYHRIYPGISYSLTVDGSNTLLQMLDSRSINAAFVISSEAALQHKEDLFSHRIMDDRYVAIVSRQNPLSARPFISMQDLQSENIIMPAKESAFRKELEQVFDQHYIAPRILCETSQSDIVMQLASQNLAIGFASNSIAQALKTEDCRIIPLEDVLLRTIYYVTLKELLDYPAIRSFTDFVIQYPFS